MVKKVARNALAAWDALRERGGLELTGRDADLEDQLRNALRPLSPTLEAALRDSSTDELVRALFAVAEPFVQMCRAIFDFFRTAQAREGREEWAILIEEEHLDLKHFEQLVKRWEALDCELEVPAVDWHGSWAVWNARSNVAGLKSAGYIDERGARQLTGVNDVDEWLHTYEHGKYPPLPASLQPSHIAPELTDAAAMLSAAVAIIGRTWPDRFTMINELRARNHRINKGDGFNVWTLAQDETDYRLGSSVVLLARYASLNRADRDTFAKDLASELARYPRRKLGVRGRRAALERILSLPLWRRRHELYAVWVATEIVNALEGHQCELHHENGRITFAFRQTVIATVHSASPKIRLYAERQSPLADPVGSGRTANVQPDYGLWRTTAYAETCCLIVEVKHYKKAAPARFREVLVDYARAHRQAQIVMVNHGPMGDSSEGLSYEIRDRCRLIGGLTASHWAKREELRKIVRELVGDPTTTGPQEEAGRARVIAIDVSVSMSGALDSPDFAKILALLAVSHVGTVALIDSAVRGMYPLEIAHEAIRATTRGTSIDLASPLQTLLENYSSVLLVTDLEGLLHIESFDTQRIMSPIIDSVALEIVDVMRAKQ
jgi:hypothetical protein